MDPLAAVSSRMDLSATPWWLWLILLNLVVGAWFIQINSCGGWVTIICDWWAAVIRTAAAGNAQKLFGWLVAIPLAALVAWFCWLPTLAAAEVIIWFCDRHLSVPKPKFKHSRGPHR